MDLIDPSAYGRTRNFLDGAVSRLSPYLRHGVLGLGEVRDAAVAGRSRAAAYKFVSELGWRDYYRRVHAAIGDGVWNDLEPYKTGERAQSYGAELPEDVLRAETGAACIDSFAGELLETGYLHNHARMWFASYLTHWRRVRWQAGAAWFLRNLVDGDPASNNLSWQWVASTFGAKPYVFNRANLERYTRGTYCSRCPLATGGGCPFEGSYERLDAKLFPNGRRVVVEETNAARAELHVSADPPAHTPPQPPGKAVVWQHEESLAASDAARSLAPEAPAIFVWDAEARRRDPWPAIRRRFVEESLAELSLGRVANGDAALEIAAFARANATKTIVATAPVDPRLRAIAAELRAAFTVTLVEPPRFATLDRPVDLRRHARYWSRAQHTAFGAAARGVPELELGIESA